MAGFVVWLCFLSLHEKIDDKEDSNSKCDNVAHELCSPGIGERLDFSHRDAKQRPCVFKRSRLKTRKKKNTMCVRVCAVCVSGGTNELKRNQSKAFQIHIRACTSTHHVIKKAVLSSNLITNPNCYLAKDKNKQTNKTKQKMKGRKGNETKK